MRYILNIFGVLHPLQTALSFGTTFSQPYNRETTTAEPQWWYRAVVSPVNTPIVLARSFSSRQGRAGLLGVRKDRLPLHTCSLKACPPSLAWKHSGSEEQLVRKSTAQEKQQQAGQEGRQRLERSVCLLGQLQVTNACISSTASCLLHGNYTFATHNTLYISTLGLYL